MDVFYKLPPGLLDALIVCDQHFIASGTILLLQLALVGPDYFDKEAKCYSRLFKFCQVTFCYFKQWGHMTLAKF